MEGRSAVIITLDSRALLFPVLALVLAVFLRRSTSQGDISLGRPASSSSAASLSLLKSLRSIIVVC